MRHGKREWTRNDRLSDTAPKGNLAARASRAKPNREAELLFQRLIDKVRAPGAASAHRRAWGVGAGLAAAGLGVFLLVLSGSIGSRRTGGVAPSSLAAEGDISAGALTRISLGMSPFAQSAAERLGLGEAAWYPPSATGWGLYDQRAPALITRDLDLEQARAFNALVEPTATPIMPMKAFVLKAGGSDRDRALLCLTQAVYYEAGFETGEGQQAVAQVVLNRVRHPGYPSSVCGVVYQGSQRVTGCQFSFTCDGSPARPPAPAAWNRSRAVAKAALNGFVSKGVGTATHYHADYVFPYWAVTLVKLKQVGTHIFYRMTGPSGSPAGFTSRYGGNEAVLTSAVLTGGDSTTPDAPSAIAPARSVTLTVGGESRTYAVAAADLGKTRSLITKEGTRAEPVGGLTPSRRAPTAEEIREINARLKAFEDRERVASAMPSAAQP